MSTFKKTGRHEAALDARWYVGSFQARLEKETSHFVGRGGLRSLRGLRREDLGPDHADARRARSCIRATTHLCATFLKLAPFICVGARPTATASNLIALLVCAPGAHRADEGAPQRRSHVWSFIPSRTARCR